LHGARSNHSAVFDWTLAREDRLTLWVVSNHWATMPAAPAGDLERGAGSRLREKNARDERPEGPDDNSELNGILDAIASDVWMRCGAVCSAITADFGARMQQARRYLPKDQAAAAVAVLSRARKAAIKAAREMAKSEVKSAQAAAKINYRRSRIRVVKPPTPEPR